MYVVVVALIYLRVFTDAQIFLLTTVGISSLKDVFYFQASHIVGQQSLEFIVPVLFGNIR